VEQAVSELEGIRESYDRRTAKLSIALLQIAEPLGEELDRYVLVIAQQMFLGGCPREVDE